MTGKPKVLSQTKAWFSLENYEVFKTLPIYQWGQQIARRYFLRNALKLGNREFLDHEMPQIMANPASAWDYSAPSTPLRPLAFADLFRLREYWFDKGISEDIFIDDCNPNELHALIPFGHLVIDLHARDKEIRSAFEAWLKSRRSDVRLAKLKKLHGDALHGWYNDRIIPYCDLKAWAEWTGQTLTEPQLIQLLNYSRDIRPNRTLIRTTANNAKKYINLGNAHALMMVPAPPEETA